MKIAEGPDMDVVMQGSPKLAKKLWLILARNPKKRKAEELS